MGVRPRVAYAPWDRSAPGAPPTGKSAAQKPADSVLLGHRQREAACVRLDSIALEARPTKRRVLPVHPRWKGQPWPPCARSAKQASLRRVMAPQSASSAVWAPSRQPLPRLPAPSASLESLHSLQAVCLAPIVRRERLLLLPVASQRKTATKPAMIPSFCRKRSR